MKRLPSFLIFWLLVSLSVSAAEPAPATPPGERRTFHLPSLYHVGYWVKDIAKSRTFYKDYLGFEEPYELRRPNGDLQMVVMKVNERQVIYLFTDAAKILPNGDNLDHLGLETDNIEAARTYLLAQGVKVGAVNRGRIGDFLLGVKDPDGHPFELTQFAPEGQLLQHQGQALPVGRVSSHLRSVSLAVADLAGALRFYINSLGFKVVAGYSVLGAVRVQVPDGTEFLELVPSPHKAGTTGARAAPDYCLEVVDAAQTLAGLSARAKTLGLAAPSPITTGSDGVRQIVCIDPDGTRVVLAETRANR